MKAIVLRQYGGSEQLKLEERAAPEPGAGQIQVRVASASINPVDWKLRSGALQAWMPLELPAVLGRDAAGEVTKLGPGVTAFKVGDKVLGLIMGAYAELAVGAVEAWAKVPADLPIEEAGALPLVLLTGDQLAEATLAGASAGQVVLVTGALGSVGRVAVQSLKGRGARVIAGVRTAQLETAKKLWDEDVVAIDDDAAIAQLEPVDRIADTVGGDTLEKLLGRVKPKGTIGTVVGEAAGAKARGFAVHAILTHPDSKRLGAMAKAVARGELLIPIATRLPLRDAQAAHDFAEAGAGGKVLLIP
jgi:NADPH:quinone reductase-like Zn-dependent oxidoreductase